MHVNFVVMSTVSWCLYQVKKLIHLLSTRWSDRTPLAINLSYYWESSQPDNNWNGEKCVLIDTDKWWDFNCEFPTSSICQKPINNKALAAIIRSNVSCPDGWTQTKDRCYKVFYDSKNWSDALNFCQSIGEKGLYDLASIPNSKDQEALINLIANPIVGDLWIGLRIWHQSHTWKYWTDNSNGNFINWETTDENLLFEGITSKDVEGSDVACVAMYTSGPHIGKWFTKNCSDSFGFICARAYRHESIPDYLLSKINIQNNEPSNTTIIVITVSVIAGILMIVTVIILILYKLRMRRKNRLALEQSLAVDFFVSNAVGENDENQYETIDEDLPKKDIEMIFELKVTEMSFLGSGNFSLVFQGYCNITYKNEKQHIVAVKIPKDFVNWSNESKEKEDFYAEIKLHYFLPPHINVINCYGQTIANGIPGLVLEFAANGTLKSLLQNWFKQDMMKIVLKDINFIENLNLKCLKFSREVASGMSHLAKHQIVHRDLAARNILMGAGDICKISDFGLARDSSASSVYCMSSNDPIPVRWLAPESLFYKKYSQKSDVWSFGILLWEIVALGGTPYHDIRTGVEVKNALLHGYRMSAPRHCSSDLYGIMQICWQENEVDRPTFDVLEKTLSQFLLDKKDYINFQNYDDFIYENINPQIYKEKVVCQ